MTYATATVRLKATGMNKTEAAYQQILHMRWLTKEIRHYEYQALTLKFGHDLRYTPDFFVVNAAGEIELHETKGGFVREDAIVKVRAAATHFHMFKFFMCKRIAGLDFTITQMTGQVGSGEME
jgi:hypothetical protein